jgi:23S rRNA (uracil1939-C5)-methyltransferase
LGKHRKEKSFVLENITIQDFAAEGKCIARHEDKVIFIEGAVAPGDVVDVRIHKQRKNFLEGQAVHFHQLSAMRISPFCQHFGTCGGCKWQHIPYETQLAQKQKQVTDHLERIAKVALPAINPILPAPQTTYYRNKLEFTCSDARWLTAAEIQSEETFSRNAIGFHMPGKFDKILDISHCYLQPEPSNAIRESIKKYALKHELGFFNAYKRHGFLRNVIIRTTTNNEVMVIVQFGYADEEKIEALMQFLADTFPQITSLNYVVNTKGNDTFFDLEVTNVRGKDYILECMEGLQFRIGAKSFYQTNAVQAYNLYKITRQMADLQGSETVYDLYTGTGTIALFVAAQAKKVVGLEYIEMAVTDARQNATLNKINNATFFAGDIKNLLSENFMETHGKPEVIITDPPRAGMDAAVIETILKAAPEKIVYVSCNPATQARDVALLDSLYAIKEVQPVDMFPQTHHVENVILLQKR